MAATSVGEISVTISGDYTELQSDLSSAEQLAASGAGAIQGAFNSAASTADAFDQKIEELVASGHTLAEALSAVNGEVGSAANALDAAVTPAEGLGDALGQVGGKAGEASPALHDAGGAAEEAGGKFNSLLEELHRAGESIDGLVSNLKALGEAFLIGETVKEFATEVIGAYDSIQKASNSLTALTGSAGKAEEVLQGIEGIAQRQPFSFPELAGTAQRMAAFGIDSEKIPNILEDVANTARATGNSFDAIAGAVERVSLSGQVSARQLVQLGVSWQDLAKTAGVSVADVQALLKKGGQDAAADLDLLLRTVEGKFSSFAQVPLTIGEQWKVLQNQMHVVFADIGSAVAPFVAIIISGLRDQIIPVITAMAAQWKAGGEAVIEFGKTIGPAVAQISSAIGALSGVTDILSTLHGWLGKDWPAFWLHFLPGVQAIDQLNNFSLMLQTVTNSGPQLTELAELAQSNFEKITHSATTTGDAFKNAYTASLKGAQAAQQEWSGTVQAATDMIRGYGNGVADVASRTKDLQSAVAVANKTMADAKNAYENGDISAAAYSVAVHNAETAQKALDSAVAFTAKETLPSSVKAIKDTALSYDDLMSAIEHGSTEGVAATKGLSDEFSVAGRKISDVVTTNLDPVMLAWGSTVKTVADAAVKALQPVQVTLADGSSTVEVYTSKLHDLENGFKSFGTSATGALGPVQQMLAQCATAEQQLADGMTAAGTAGVSAANSMTSAFTSLDQMIKQNYLDLSSVGAAFSTIGGGGAGRRGGISGGGFMQPGEKGPFSFSGFGGFGLNDTALGELAGALLGGNAPTTGAVPIISGGGDFSGGGGGDTGGIAAMGDMFDKLTGLIDATVSATFNIDDFQQIGDSFWKISDAAPALNTALAQVSNTVAQAGVTMSAVSSSLASSITAVTAAANMSAPSFQTGSSAILGVPQMPPTPPLITGNAGYMTTGTPGPVSSGWNQQTVYNIQVTSPTTSQIAQDIVNKLQRSGPRT